MNINDLTVHAVQSVLSTWLGCDESLFANLDLRLTGDLGVDPFELDDVTEELEHEFSVELGRDCDLRNPDKDLTIRDIVRAIREKGGIPFLVPFGSAATTVH